MNPLVSYTDEYDTLIIKGLFIKHYWGRGGGVGGFWGRDGAPISQAKIEKPPLPQ